MISLFLFVVILVCLLVVLELTFSVLLFDRYIGIVKWLTRRTIDLRIASRMGSTNRSFLEQDTLHSLLSTGYFQERIRG